MTVLDTDDACEHKARQFQYLEQSDVVRTIDSSHVSTVAGCRKFHHIRTLKPDELQTREFSCFCSKCKSEQYNFCLSAHAENWVSRNIRCVSHAEPESEDDEDDERIFSDSSDDLDSDVEADDDFPVCFLDISKNTVELSYTLLIVLILCVEMKIVVHTITMMTSIAMESVAI